MKLIYTNENRFLVANARNIVENAGIAVRLKNEYAAGGVGDLAPIDAWLELWVLEDNDYEQSIQIIESSLSRKDAKGWVCDFCKEENGSAFELCWNCQREKAQLKN
jgi:hypothetical protein